MLSTRRPSMKNWKPLKSITFAALVVAVTTSLAGLASIAIGQKAPGGGPGGGPLRVIDSNNREVGPTVSEFNSVAIYLNFADMWSKLRVNKNGFTEDSPNFFYESSDCSGTGNPGIYLAPDELAQYAVVHE